jgi:hypothetical protein
MEEVVGQGTAEPPSLRSSLRKICRSSMRVSPRRSLMFHARPVGLCPVSSYLNERPGRMSAKAVEHRDLARARALDQTDTRAPTCAASRRHRGGHSRRGGSQALAPQKHRLTRLPFHQSLDAGAESLQLRIVGKKRRATHGDVRNGSFRDARSCSRFPSRGSLSAAYH